MKIVRAFSIWGRFLVAILRLLLRIVSIFKGKKWNVPPQGFHDDPRHFRLKDILFFAYKYYFKPPVVDDADGKVRLFFEENPPSFEDQQIDFEENFTQKTSVTLHAAGDLMPYEWIRPAFCPHLWDDIADVFFSADLHFANLETPIDPARPAALVPEIMLNDMLFNGDEAMFTLFNNENLGKNAPPQYSPLKKGFDVLSTANNHALDMGEKGVATTIEYLKNKNIKHVGTAISEAAQQDFPIFEKNNIKIAFIAYTYSMNQLTNPDGKSWLVNHIEINQPDCDLSPIRRDVQHAHARGADVVVLSLHFGNAYQTLPGAHILENTKRVFETCGVDVILGSHPHNPQPSARFDFDCPIRGERRAGFVVFSLADFIAFDIFNWCHLPLIAKLKFEKGISIKNNLEKTIVSFAQTQPVFVCGTYRNATNRDLRLLDAQKLVEKIKKNTPPQYLDTENAQKVLALMDWHEKHIAFNQKR